MASSLKNTSTAMSAVTSYRSPCLLHRQDLRKILKKRSTPTFSKPLSSSAMNSSIPSTSDVFALILQMKDRMQRQDETNERILREIGDLKRQKKAAEDHSPLMPKSLSFDTPMITSQSSGIPDVQIRGVKRITSQLGSNDSDIRFTFSANRILSSVHGILHESGSLSGGTAVSRILLYSRIIPGPRILLCSRIIPGSRILLCSRIIPGSRILFVPGSSQIPGILTRCQDP
ncbi:hypothetical protein HanPSC8_Chr04g0175941 [Helianthus annuus]|nr:hypothetical protein HanPSC8_Chr04g0175941 [Helianthus annuus]